MAQTQLMLRLLKDGKIVGYHLMDCKSIIGSFNTRVDMHGFNGLIEYDSIEQGIKVGETWVFGDEKGASDANSR